MTTLFGIVIGAVLFALFAVAGPRGCTGQCAGCACARRGHETGGDSHVV